MPALVLLLPPLAALNPLDAAGGLGRALARADALPALLPARPWCAWFSAAAATAAVAPLSAVHDGLDVDSAYWLRADPATFVADLNALRVIAVGRSGLSLEQARALATVPAERCAELGATLIVAHPERWYLRLPEDAHVPVFAEPEGALGADLRAHLPSGPDAARWQWLANEIQIALHNDPINRARARAGMPPVNGVWFWGGGVAPRDVDSTLTAVVTPDPVLAGLARRAGVAVAQAVEPGLPDAHLLLDLRSLQDCDGLERNWIEPALDALARGVITTLDIGSADGRCWRVRAAQRWRFWRRRFSG